MLKIINHSKLFRISLITHTNSEYVWFSSQTDSIPKGFQKKPNINEIKADYIGPPDEKSNIRPILRHIPPNETKAQEKLRIKRLEAENYVSTFWTNHNKRFFTERSEFLAKRENKEVSADEMSEFYKTFLNKNSESHFYFNIVWYMKNFELLYLAFIVNVEKGLQRIKK
ncbi:hypothetical protein PVAND_007346 [Polypedilum vanderplanki]|uniref:Uncharacterized protein n=1 Tax=Polypedilum vanderplanki TaxID=319348 RepID=A0A9J6C6E9_POLVA|nr:hypothetical protein PVAND_007346 [Polypedilum vanderplanki]